MQIISSAVISDDSTDLSSWSMYQLHQIYLDKMLILPKKSYVSKRRRWRDSPITATNILMMIFQQLPQKHLKLVISCQLIANQRYLKSTFLLKRNTHTSLWLVYNFWIINSTFVSSYYEKLTSHNFVTVIGKANSHKLSDVFGHTTWRHSFPV